MKRLILQFKWLYLIALALFITNCAKDSGLSEPVKTFELVFDSNNKALDIIASDKNEDLSDLIVRDEPPAEEVQEKVTESKSSARIEKTEVLETVNILEDPEPTPELICTKKSYTVTQINGDKLTDVMSYKGGTSTAMNYNYYSWSAHPIMGPAPNDYEGNFFLYEGSDGMALNFFFNIDAGGSSHNKVQLDVEVKNNTLTDSVILSDDALEVQKVDTASPVSLYKAAMEYWYNTDGAVIGPFDGDDLEIKVRVHNIGDTKTLAFHAEDGRHLALKQQSNTLYSEFLIKYEELKTTDCSSQDELKNAHICAGKLENEYKSILTETDPVKHYRQKLIERKAAIVKLIKEDAKARKAVIEYYGTLRTTLKNQYVSNKDSQHEKYLLNLKACNKIEDNKEKQTCKKGHSIQNESIKSTLYSTYLKTRDALHEERRNAITSFNKNAIEIRKSLAEKLLKEALESRAQITDKQIQVHEELAKKVRACYK